MGGRRNFRENVRNLLLTDVFSLDQLIKCIKRVKRVKRICNSQFPF
jgi:hypothetical protein